MRYALMTTTLYLLLIDLQTKQTIPLESKRPEYYGISWFPDGASLILSHSGLDTTNLVDVTTHAQSEKGWISAGTHVSKPVLSAPHQIFCAPDGKVICTNTGRNVVTVLDFKHPTTFQEAGISNSRWDRMSADDPSGDHLNSVFLQGDKLYVLAHGHRKGSQLGIFSYPELNLISLESLGAKLGMHNIWVTSEGQRISCHSETGSVVDLNANKPLWEAGSPIYTRGIAATDDYVLIGESQISGRNLRSASLSGLWILDRKNWRAIDYLALGPYGGVHEVRILDAVDQAHHGHPFTGITQLLGDTLPDQLRKSRLNTATLIYETKHIWADYQLIFGGPEVLQDGSKRTSTESLCLVLRQNSNNRHLNFTYALNPAQTSHVSVVVGYSGSGDDTHMTAFLIQPQGESASLSVWRHDGLTWTSLPNIAIPLCPLNGKLECEISEKRLTIIINKKKVLSMSATELGLNRCDVGLGIRWLGADVRPSV